MRVEYREEPCRSALNRVKGMPFDWSLNPYTGCAHRCTFCYVRAFEARADRPSDDRYGRSIRVKVNIAEALRRELARTSWKRESVAIGAATDPYQPAEGRYRLTRACIRELGAARTPFSLITRGPMVRRDVDVLAEAAGRAKVHVSFSVPTLDERIWRATEPGTAPPRRRLETVRILTDAGIDTGVALAPILPGLSDDPKLLDRRGPGGTRRRGERDLGERPLPPPGNPGTLPRGARVRLARAPPRVRAALRRPLVPAGDGDRACARGGTGARAAHVGAASASDQAGAGAPAARARRVIGGRRPTPLVESHSVAENNEITVLIADDHEVVREGLRLALLRSSHIRVVGEAPDGETAVALAERRRPDVVIMDLRMPQMDGIEATEEIVSRVPDTSVLVFTAYSERALLQRGLESGARGYVLKEAPHETLLKAIEKVASGETFVDPALIPALATGRDGQEILTAREREILQLLADGMSNADVAQQLFISQETVKSHVRHILAKLEAETRTQAVAIALREAMID